jgi:hypothetical protein
MKYCTLGGIYAACIIEHEHANIFPMLMSAWRGRRFDPSYECMKRRSDPSGSRGFSGCMGRLKTERCMDTLG